MTAQSARRVDFSPRLRYHLPPPPTPGRRVAGQALTETGRDDLNMVMVEQGFRKAGTGPGSREGRR
jgi:hypothetical protein